LIAPSKPANEEQRLKALHRYDILDSGKDEAFDQIATLAARITHMPIALISLVDEDTVWFKSTIGINLDKSTRELSFCSHAISGPEQQFVVNDLTTDPRFHDHPYVINPKSPLQFYAGVALLDADGHALGTLCVLDRKPNSITDEQLDILKTLAKQVVKLIELHRNNRELEKAWDQLKLKNQDLRDFAGRVSHDMKMPLANMIVTSDIIKARYQSKLDKEAYKYLDYLKDSAFSLSEYISGMLTYYESDRIAEEKVEQFNIYHLLEDIIELLNIDQQVEIDFPADDLEISCNRTALEQIILNLLGNSLKYNDKEVIKITIDVVKEDDQYHFTISDNGMGIPPDKLESIFGLFSTVGTLDRHGRKGNGIGLSTVQKLVERLGGTISVRSEVGNGTTFDFTVSYIDNTIE
jgi:signal transduction histidine kinase